MGLEVGEGAAVAGYWIWAWGGRIGGGGQKAVMKGGREQEMGTSRTKRLARSATLNSHSATTQPTQALL